MRVVDSMIKSDDGIVTHLVPFSVLIFDYSHSMSDMQTDDDTHPKGPKRASCWRFKMRLECKIGTSNRQCSIKFRGRNFRPTIKCDFNLFTFSLPR